jgi:FkbM family methyltransferase
MIKELKLINNDIKNLDISPLFIQSHFNGARNCTGPILDQINNNYYDKFITPDDKVIIDLGANIGLVSIHLSPYADKIISVEPTPNHFSILEHFTKDIPNIYRLQGAISDKRETTSFYLLDDTTENSLISEKGGAEIQVETYTLKDIIDLYNLDIVDFVKIDIEGSEIKFLSLENIETLNNYVKKFFIEFHYVNGKTYGELREYYQDIFKTAGWNTELVSVDVLYCYK